MVIHILLSLLDVVTALVLFTHTTLGWFSIETVLFHATLTILKGLLFFLGDLASKVDVVVGIYMLSVAFGIFSYNIITIMAVVWLVQKMIFIIAGFINRVFF